MSAPVRVLLVAAVVALSAGAAPAPAAPTELIGEVGPERTISLKDTDGNLVLVLDPGTYAFTIHDNADVHNFRLFGPGVNQATEVAEVGTVVWTVTLSEGTYSYMCDPHAQVMRGSFRVRAPAPPPPQLLGTLFAAVAGKRASLRSAEGTAVTSLSAGLYAVVVRDGSAKQSFRLAGAGVSRSSGARFKGTARWRITFRAGIYRYWSSPKGRRRMIRVQ
jgi:hypothetical protein